MTKNAIRAFQIILIITAGVLVARGAVYGLSSPAGVIDTALGVVIAVFAVPNWRFWR